LGKIEVQNLWWKYYGSDNWALKGISFDLNAGEVLGIVGPSGAGKSTLCLALNGLIPQRVRGSMKGRVIIDGMDTRKVSLRYIVSKVGLVFQDPDTQLVTMSVWDEIAFTLENFCCSPEEYEEKIERVLEIVGLNGLESKHPFELSAGQKQRLAIASALVVEPEILILDEPTSNLDPVGRREIFDLLFELKRKGYTMVIVEHETDELARLADKLLILNEGKEIAFDSASKLFRSVELLKEQGVAVPQIAELFYYLKRKGYSLDEIPLIFEDGRNILKKVIRRADVYDKIREYIHEEPIDSKPPIIEINELHFRYPDGTHALKGINLTISDGEFVAIVGKNGSGKTTLAKTISGLLKPTYGEVKLFNRDVQNIPRKELVTLVGYSFQNPDHQLFLETVQDELAFGPRNLGLPEEEVQKRVIEVAKKLGLEQYLDEHPFFLSKGLRLRLAVGSILTMKPKIIIVDEPTTGQDWRQSEDLMELLAKLNQEGKTIIFLTHHMRYVAEYARRCIVMDDGRVLLDAPTRQAFRYLEKLRIAYAEPPPISILTYELLGEPALTVNEAVRLLEKIIPKKLGIKTTRTIL